MRITISTGRKVGRGYQARLTRWAEFCEAALACPDTPMTDEQLARRHREKTGQPTTAADVRRLRV